MKKLTKKEARELFDFHFYSVKNRRGANEYIVYAKYETSGPHFSFICVTGESTKKWAFKVAYQAICDLSAMSMSEWEDAYRLDWSSDSNGNYAYKGAAYDSEGRIKVGILLSQAYSTAEKYNRS